MISTSTASASNLFKSRRSAFQSILTILLLIYVSGTILGGIGLGWIALHPPRHQLLESEQRNAAREVQSASSDLHDVDLTASDGTLLKGWLIRPKNPNGDAVILLHGVSDNRMGMYGFGKWLAEKKYTVLMPDARSHGESGGLASYGLRESDDIHKWVDWIEANDHPRCVYGLGESMGAAELLQALPKEHHFCAVVAESPFATFREVAYARFGRAFHTGPWLGRTLFRPTVDVGFLYVYLRYGLNMEHASPAAAVAATRIPVLLIHGAGDTNIPPYHSDLIQTMNPGKVVVWKVQGAGHTGASRAAPEEFEKRVLSWFTTHSQSE